MRISFLSIFVMLLFLMPFVFAQVDEDLSGRNDSLYIIDDQTTPNVNKTFAEQRPCQPGFKETLTIRAFDKELNAIKNVEIITKHQIDFTTGKGYYTSPPRYTDENGTVKIQIVNTETRANKVDCNVEINATLNNVRMRKVIIATSHPQNIDFVFPAARLTVEVIDQNNKPLEGAKIYVNNLIGTTNEFGLTSFVLILSNHTVVVKYWDYQVEKNANLNGKAKLSVEIPIYNTTIKFFDDNGKPLNASLLLGGQEYVSNEAGEIIATVAGSFHKAIAIYNNIERNVEFDLSKQNDAKIVFDFNAPKIKNLNVSESENGIRVTLQGVDNGGFASGIPTNGLSARYTIDNGPGKQATIYVRAFGIFVVEIPAQIVGKTITFSFEMRDNDGNKQNLEAKYVAKGVTAENNGTDVITPPNGEKSEFPLIPIIGGILILCVVIVVFYTVFRLRSQEKS